MSLALAGLVFIVEAAGECVVDAVARSGVGEAARRLKPYLNLPKNENADIARAARRAHVRACRWLLAEAADEIKGTLAAQDGIKASAWRGGDQRLRDVHGYLQRAEGACDGENAWTRFAGNNEPVAAWQAAIVKERALIEEGLNLLLSENEIGDADSAYVTAAVAEVMAATDWVGDDEPIKDLLNGLFGRSYLEAFEGYLSLEIKTNDPFQRIWTALELTALREDARYTKEALDRVEPAIEALTEVLAEILAALAEHDEKSEKNHEKTHTELAAIREENAQLTTMFARLLPGDNIDRDQLLRGFLARMGEQNVPPEQYEERLEYFAARFKEIEAQLATGRNLPSAFEAKRAAAKQAAEAGDLDRAENILADLRAEMRAQREQSLREEAAITAEQAAVVAIRDPFRAADLYEEAANLLPPDDWGQAHTYLIIAGDLLDDFGKRFGRGGLARAEKILRHALDLCPEEKDPYNWALTQNNLGIALNVLGERGQEGALHQAVAAYSAALRVRTEADYPVDWAVTQNNLGNALVVLGDRGQAGALEEAVAAYRAALRVYTEADYPAQWATIHNNLGATLRVLGNLGQAGALEEAVDAYRAALRVRTEADYPVQWAMTTANLGLAYQAKADVCKARDVFIVARDKYLALGLTAYAERVQGWLDDLDDERS